MEAGTAYCLIGTVTAFACGGLCAFAAARGAASARVASSGGDAFAARLMRTGVAPLKPLARMLARNRRIGGLFEGVAAAAQGSGIAASPIAALSVALSALIAAFALGWAATAHAAGGLAFALCLGAIAWAALGSVKEKRREEMREAVPDALRAMMACFRSGQSLLQTMQQVGKGTSGALGSLFLRVAHTLETGGTSREALSVFEGEGSIRELAFVAVALDVHHQTGGSMERVLDSAREGIEGELSLARQLRVQTAQAKLSARIVSVMPLVLIVLFSLVSEDFFAPFLSSFTGMCLLAAAIAMQVAGVLIVRRMLKVEVG